MAEKCIEAVEKLIKGRESPMSSKEGIVKTYCKKEYIPELDAERTVCFEEVGTAEEWFTPCSRDLLKKYRDIVVDRMKSPRTRIEANMLSTAVWYACNKDAPLDPIVHSVLWAFGWELDDPFLCVKAFELWRPAEDLRVRTVPDWRDLPEAQPFEYGPYFLHPSFPPSPAKGVFSIVLSDADEGEVPGAYWSTLAKLEPKVPSWALIPPKHLREYQKKPYQRTMAALFTHKGALLQAPTGFGKTVVGATILNSLLEHSKIEKAAVLVPNTPLIPQWESAIKRFCPECEGRVAVTTYQAVYWWLKHAGVKVRRQASSFLLADPLVPEELPPADRSWEEAKEEVKHYMESDFVVLDEVHAVKAKTFAYVLDANKNAVRLGLSATPTWLKSSYSLPILVALVGPIVLGPKPVELMEIGALARLETAVVRLPRMGCRRVGRRYESPVQCFSRPEPAEKYCELAFRVLASEQAISWLGQKAVILVPTLRLGECLAEKLGIPFVHSSNKELLEELRKYDSGWYVATTLLIQVGFDDPKLTGLALLDPVSRPERLKQILGRVLRISERKRVARVLDFCIEDYKRGCEKRREVYEEYGPVKWFY